jgi:predicted Rossmann fold flavoprotein
MHDLIIVGGGAAGLWAAAVAASRGLKVLVLEKNVKSGVKILMSGGTRCNITHHCSPQQIVEAYGAQGRFIKPAVFALPPQRVVEQFNSWGVATKVEETGKVFPVSNRAIEVRDALVTQLRLAGAELRTGVAVKDIAPVSDAGDWSNTTAERPRWQVTIENQVLYCSNVLLCTGGLSYPGCGTTGDGYQWARNVGHTINPTFPALAPLVSPAAWVHQLTGITLADVQVHLRTSDRKEKDPRRSCRSSFLWTHFGCSGPAPMNVSRFVAQHEQARALDPSLPRAILEVDLLPNMAENELPNYFDPSKFGKRRVSSLLSDWLPHKLVEHLLQAAEVVDSQLIAELPKKSRLQLISQLKRLPVPIDTTRGYAKAEVTSGGVCTSEVDPRTLESRLARGLYFAGEILDIDGPIGGYNFQAAFATANAVALSVGRTAE